MKKTKRRRKKRIGIRLAILLSTLLPLTAAPKKKPVLETYALISGSVFQDSGYALGGADVTIAADTETGHGSGRFMPVQLVSSARGEFAVRVPPGPMKYAITVHAKGYQSQEKTVMVNDQERVEVTFQLEAESK